MVVFVLNGVQAIHELRRESGRCQLLLVFALPIAGFYAAGSSRRARSAECSCSERVRRALARLA